MMKTEAEAVADALFEAIETGDFAAAEALYAPDIGVWHNFSRAAQDKTTNLQVLRQSRQAYEMSYDIKDRIVDGNRIIQQHTLTTRLPDGQTFILPAAIFITVQNGLITRIEEYLDSGQVNAIRAASGRELLTPNVSGADVAEHSI
jgi:ketosteroid isomerase-like protein